MAAALRRPLPTLKVKNVPPPRLPSPEKATTKSRRNERELSPLEERLLNIRLHLLQNTSRRMQQPSEPTLVYDSFLYLGGLQSLNHKTRLARLKITHILSVVFIQPAKSLIPANVKHLFLKADDNVAFNMLPYFAQACAFIEEARATNGAVLVHCVCGISRSTTLCCAYLMTHHSMTVEQALVQLRSRRHIIQPNPGFIRQLVLYGDRLQNEQSNGDTTTTNEQSKND